MSVLTLVLMTLVLLALIALWGDLRGDGYGTRCGPRSHHPDLPPWPRF